MELQVYNNMLNVQEIKLDKAIQNFLERNLYETYNISTQSIDIEENKDIDFIKIDGSLIKNIDQSKDLEIIVKTISNIAKEFDIKTVAEFVANEHIYNKVKELNIDYSQGYFFDKPLKYEDIV